MPRTATTLLLAGLCTIAGMAVATPSQAAAGITPERACGPGYVRVSDGTREIRSGSAVYGRLYLLYSNRTGRNCLALIKSINTHTSTRVKATLHVKGAGGKSTSGRTRSYATVTRSAAGRCVMYSGEIANASGTKVARGGRGYWGNCG
ncbi:hypothetical protein [Nonomuraea sp. B1E8]|uniref:hypothetical protein n=1 Tax=unclassified Nonomuraea TaxID=2593643 RepID=UPI00325CBCD1